MVPKISPGSNISWLSTSNLTAQCMREFVIFKEHLHPPEVARLTNLHLEDAWWAARSWPSWRGTCHMPHGTHTENGRHTRKCSRTFGIPSGRRKELLSWWKDLSSAFFGGHRNKNTNNCTGGDQRRRREKKARKWNGEKLPNWQTDWRQGPEDQKDPPPNRLAKALTLFICECVNCDTKCVYILGWLANFIFGQDTFDFNGHTWRMSNRSE